MIENEKSSGKKPENNVSGDQHNTTHNHYGKSTIFNIKKVKGDVVENKTVHQTIYTSDKPEKQRAKNKQVPQLTMQEQIEDLVKQDELELALERLKEALAETQYPKQKELVVHLQAQLTQFTHQKTLKEMSIESFWVETSKIRQAILELSTKLNS